MELDSDWVKRSAAVLMATGLRHALSSIISILLVATFALPSPSAADGAAATLGSYPPTCERIECPSYDVIDKGSGYEIRRYISPVWMSTSSMDDISFVNATRIGFLR